MCAHRGTGCPAWPALSISDMHLALCPYRIRAGTAPLWPEVALRAAAHVDRNLFDAIMTPDRHVTIPHSSRKATKKETPAASHDEGL